MKKFILLLAVMFMASGLACFAEDIKLSPIVKSAVEKYRGGNYTGAIQDCQEAIKKDPNDMVAHYYMAISYAQIGEKTSAQNAYNEVITNSKNKTLVELATKGNLCVSTPAKCKPQLDDKLMTEVDKFVQSGQFISDELQKKIRDQGLRNIQDQINNGQEPNLNQFPAVNKSDNSDYPTDKQIADAVRVLARAGLNPLGNFNPMTQNDEMMQLNMLLGFNGNKNQDYMNLMPYMMSSPQNMSPELIQTMMMSQMIPDFGFDSRN